MTAYAARLRATNVGGTGKLLRGSPAERPRTVSRGSSGLVHIVRVGADALS